MPDLIDEIWYPIVDPWILYTGFWRDLGVWQDDDFWRDDPRQGSSWENI